MLKSRKVNNTETITMILISKYIIRRIVMINHVKRTHEDCNCMLQLLLLYDAW